MKPRSYVLLLFLMFASVHLFAAGEHCPSIYLATIPSTGHTAAKLVDPAGQQTALFDLTWGGILVSLQYQGVEYIAAPTTKSGAQTLLSASNYTPTMGGDSQNRGSVVVGAACSANHLWLTSGMTDYNQNAGTSTAYVYKNNQWYFDHLMAPYVVSTHAYFIPNPAGSPAYYLKLDQTINNIDGNDIDGQENFSFMLDLSMAVPTAFSNYAANPAYCDFWGPCYNNQTAVTIGYYNSPSLTSGLAMTTFPASQWGSDPGFTMYATESFADRRVLHFDRYSWSVAPQHSKTHSLYLMVGSWANANSFALNACNFTVSTPPYHVGVNGTTGTVSVTTNGACHWEASSDVPWTTVTPSSGTGSGTVTYTVLANDSNAVRRANLNIAGRIFPLFQDK
jgi:hypothetical protein